MSIVESMCGLLCSSCDYKESTGCKGCIESNGHPFHGECSVAKCVIDKKLSHCGECVDFPCDLLKQFSYDTEQGDNGARIEQCKAWCK